MVSMRVGAAQVASAGSDWSLMKIFARKAELFQRLSATRAQETVDNRIFRPETPPTSHRVEPVDAPLHPAHPLKGPPTANVAASWCRGGAVSVAARDGGACSTRSRNAKGLRNRSQALLQLIEQGRATAQQTT